MTSRDPKVRTVTDEATVHADWQRVIDWWSDPSGHIAWKQRMEQSAMSEIAWSESVDDDRRVTEGRWTTRQGSDIIYTLIREPERLPEKTFGGSEYVIRNELAIREYFSAKRCGLTQGSVVTTFRPSGVKTAIRYSYSWSANDEGWWDRLLPPVSVVFAQRQGFRNRCRQCERELTGGAYRKRGSR
jgi:hypothetical protein